MVDKQLEEEVFAMLIGLRAQFRDKAFKTDIQSEKDKYHCAADGLRQAHDNLKAIIDRHNQL